MNWLYYLFCLLGHMNLYHTEHSLCNLTRAHGGVHFATCCPCWGIIARGTGFGRWGSLDGNFGHLPQLRRRRAGEVGESAIHSVAVSQRVRTLPWFGLGLITGYPSPLCSNSVTTQRLINSTFHEQALYWSLQSSIAPNLNPSSNPASTLGTIPRIRPLRDATTHIA